jgi:hypothetical protein
MIKELREGKISKLLLDEENVDLILSYSRVSDFDRNGPKALLEKSTIDNQGVKMGSLIDDLTFSPKEFKDKYYISNFNEPTATLGILTKIILKNYIEIPSEEEILNIVEKNGFWKSIKDKDKIKANFNIPEFWGYLKDMFNSKNKTLITDEEKIKAQDVSNIILTHPHSKYIFDETKEIIYQYKFKTKIDKFYFRGIIDILIIDHENKTIKFVDLKTGSNSAEEFVNSFIKLRYYLQEAVYCQAYKDILENLGLENYILEPFEFLYVGLKEKIPVRYIITKKWSDSALNGFKTLSGYTYKGLYELLDEIYFHWKNKIYDLPKNIYENKGIINLEDNFIL